jgi:peroxin-1
LLHDTQQGDPVQTRAIAESFISAVDRCSSSDVLILATANEPSELHATLRSKHVFGRVVMIPNPDSGMRQAVSGRSYPGPFTRDLCSTLDFQVLTMIIQREYLEKAKLSAPATFDYVSLAQQTEGYTPADLKDLVGIAIQQSLIRQSHSTDVVSSSGWHTQPSLCDC